MTEPKSVDASPRAQRFADYLRLPPRISDYERGYLARMNRLALIAFWFHVPVLASVAWATGASPLRAFLYASFVLAGPTFAYSRVANPRTVSTVLGVTSMLLGGLLVHFGQGPMQIEMHFYFFVLLALQAVFANPSVIVASAVTVALHHLLLFYLLPSSVFNYEASIATVLVHALFVVIDSVAACFVARSFFDDVIGLDELVQRRTCELDARNQDLQLVLDHVEQGLVTIDLAGTITGARSAAADRWLGTCAPGVSLSDRIGEASPKLGAWLRMGLEDVAADVMPRELTLAQLPQAMSIGERELRLEYLPIERAGHLERLLVVMTDVTATLAQAASEREGHELAVLLERSSSDATAVSEFVDETTRLAATIGEGGVDRAERLRALHTLKGNAAVFGLGALASSCNDLEARVAEDAAALDIGVGAVQRHWSALRGRIDPLLRRGDDALARVPNEELVLTAEAVIEGMPVEQIAARMVSWTREPVVLRFERMREQASHLAAKLGKPAPSVEIEAHGIRLSRRRYAPLWSALVHALRNALDHGIESSDERLACGKAAEGHIRLETDHRGPFVEIRLIDDGRGIDWSKIRTAAAARGLPHGSIADLEAALFADGVSTRSEATDISGRGVGMAALRDVVRALDGELYVDTRSGQGTTIVVRIARAEADIARDLHAARISLLPGTSLRRGSTLAAAS